MPRATKVVKVRILNPDFLGLKPVFSRICTVKTEYKLRNAELNPCLKTSSLPHQSDITILLFFLRKDSESGDFVGLLSSSLKMLFLRLRKNK